MAITWTPTITPLNIAAYEATISATRIDSEDPDNPITVTVPKAKIKTAANGEAVELELWEKYQAIVSLNAANSDFVTDREAALKNGLEGRE